MRQGKLFGYMNTISKLLQLEFSQRFACGEAIGKPQSRAAERVEVEGLDAVVDGVVHAFLHQCCVCVDEAAVEGEVESADGGGVVSMREKVRHEVCEAV